MMEDDTFTIIDAEGKQMMYEIIFTFDDDETKKSYVIYTDNTKNDEGKLNLYASSYKLNKGNLELETIKSEKEWKAINVIINSIRENLS